MSADENLSFDLSGIADGDFNSTNLVYRSDSNFTSLTISFDVNDTEGDDEYDIIINKESSSISGSPFT